jgi:hypothetical protein
MAPLGHAGGLFRAIHDALVGCRIDWAAFDRDAHPPALLARARRAWAYRVETEFRSIQVMTRFLGEVLAAGDPLEVYAGAATAISDEIRHTALSAGMLEALGGVAELPEPLVEEEHADYLALPMPARALATAVSMLAVSETVSVALISDLRARCTEPVVRAVLDATGADEDEHGDYGWDYVRASLGRFDAAGRELGKVAARATIVPLLDGARAALVGLPAERRTLDAWPEPELAALGLLGREREALLIESAIRDAVTPRLAELGLA